MVMLSSSRVNRFDPDRITSALNQVAADSVRHPHTSQTGLVFAMGNLSPIERLSSRLWSRR